MATTQIDGGKQIRSATITTTQLSASAGITDGQLATSYIKADGTRAFTGEVAGVTPTSTASLATKGYVDGIAQGLDQKPSARVQTATETLTVASGSVTTIGGTTVDGVTVAVNDYVLIPNAPASTGAAGGVGVYTTQPGNGLYKVSAVAANISVARAPEQSGSINPAGDYVFVEIGSSGNSGFRVTSPSSGAAFTYGTTNMVWTQFSGAGEVLVGSGLTKSGNTLDRAALTGDVTASAGSNATTIANNVVTYAKFQQVAANSVVGNLSGSTANAGAVSAVSAATASTVATRDTNANTRANNVIENFQSVTSAAGTTTLTVGSPKVTQITGATTQTVVLPDATTLVVGQAFTITNRSSGNVTVNANGGGLIQTMIGGSFLTVTVTAIGTAAGSWDAAYTAAGGSGSVTTVSVVTANGFAGSVSNASTTPAITLTTGITGVLKGNGTAISAATAGTDYMAPSNFVTRETPTGTLNGSNKTFTTANTPLSGTEHFYINGLLMEPGSGNDYQISGTTITIDASAPAPVAADKLRISYQK